MNHFSRCFFLSKLVLKILIRLCFAFPLVSFAQNTELVKVAAVAGTHQIVNLGESLPEPLVAKVTHNDGSPFAGIKVNFLVSVCFDFFPPTYLVCPGNGANGSFVGEQYKIETITDSAGYATAPTFFAGNEPGHYSIVATVLDQEINGISFTSAHHSRPVFSPDPPHPPGEWLLYETAFFQIEQLDSMPATLPLTAKMGGMYYDPQRSGEGWQLNFGTSNGKLTLVATWLTYEKGQQRWLIGSANYQPTDTEITLELLQTSGASFGRSFSSADVVTTHWGHAVLRWQDCNTLNVNYRRNDGLEDTLNLVRSFYNLVDTFCQ